MTGTGPGPVVEVTDLIKSYGGARAVDGVSFTVERGAVFGLVGPNGAGKTTTVECIEGLRTPDRGRVRVFGLDPVRHRREVFLRLGVQLQDHGMYDSIRAGEAVRLFASMHPAPLPPGRLLAELGLEGKERSYYARLSGGQKRKLSTAVALVGRPELVILDEPTSGLDPGSRRDFWVTLRRYRAEGLTLLLTTHDMQEAEEHCDTLCILDRGRIVARGAPRELLREHGLVTRLSLPATGAADPAELARHPAVVRVEVVGDRIHLYGTGDGLLAELSARLGREAKELAARPANLEDLYLLLTGHDYGEAEA